MHIVRSADGGTKKLWFVLVALKDKRKVIKKATSNGSLKHYVWKSPKNVSFPKSCKIRHFWGFSINLRYWQRRFFWREVRLRIYDLLHVQETCCHLWLKNRNITSLYAVDTHFGWCIVYYRVFKKVWIFYELTIWYTLYNASIRLLGNGTDDIWRH